jgi:hypothetical protein
MESYQTVRIGGLSTALVTKAEPDDLRMLAKDHDAIIGAENLLIDIEAIINEPESFFEQAVRFDGKRFKGNQTICTLLDDLQDTGGTYVLGTCIEEIGSGIYALSSPILTSGMLSMRRKLTPLPEVRSYEETGALLGGIDGARRFKHTRNFIDGSASQLQRLIRNYHQLAGVASLESFRFGTTRTLPLICNDAERSIALYTGERISTIAYLSFNAHLNEADLTSTLTKQWHELEARDLTTEKGVLAYVHGGHRPMKGVVAV